MSRDERDGMREGGEDKKRREKEERRVRNKDERTEIKEEKRNSRSEHRDEASSRRDRRGDGRDGKRERGELLEEVKLEVRDDVGEPSKSRPRHTSRSDSEATNSQRGSSPPSMADRLLAISSSSGEREARGKWLTEKIEDHFSKNGIDQSAPPTEEEIKMQLKLPSKEAIERNEFKEPLTIWEPVEGTGIPGWNKELLPEEEIVRPPDWRPPTPPRVDIRLVQYVDEFKKDEEPELPKIGDIFTSKEDILRKDIKDDDEVVLYNSECIIRTTKAGIKKSKRDRENEEAEEERMFRGGGREVVLVLGVETAWEKRIEKEELRERGQLALLQEGMPEVICVEMNLILAEAERREETLTCTTIEETGTDMAVVEMVTGIDLLLAERVGAEDNHSRGRKEDPHLLQRDIQTAVERNLGGQVKGEKAMEDQEIGVKGLQTGGIAMVVPDLLTEGRVLVIIGAGVT